MTAEQAHEVLDARAAIPARERVDAGLEAARYAAEHGTPPPVPASAHASTWTGPSGTVWPLT